MKVKIVRSLQPHYWYASMIGQIVEVQRPGFLEKTFYKAIDKSYGNIYIMQCDCEEIDQ